MASSQRRIYLSHEEKTRKVRTTKISSYYLDVNKKQTNTTVKRADIRNSFLPTTCLSVKPGVNQNEIQAIDQLII